MKNLKAILLIVLGSFFIATGFAFAESEKTAYRDLELTAKSIEMPVVEFTNQGAARDVVVTKAAAPVVAPPPAPAIPAYTKVEPVKPAPTFMEKTKKYIGDNMSQIVSAAAIGFLAMLVIGTGGAGLLVGLLAFGLFMGLKSL